MKLSLRATFSSVFAFVLACTASSFAQQADRLEVYDTTVRRAITPMDSGERAAGPVATFDIAAFRGDLSDRGPAVDPSAEHVDEKPVVLPREYIDWHSGQRAAGPSIVDDYYFDSAIDQGASYGYQTTDYTFDATCRTVTTVPAENAEAATDIRSGRSALTLTRTGYVGTINVANLSCLVELACVGSKVPGDGGSSVVQVEEHEDEPTPSCLQDGAADALFISSLECGDDGLCYQIEEMVP